MRRPIILLLAAAVAACAHVPRADPQVADEALRIKSDAKALFDGLAGKVAPACGYAANTGAYDALKAEVATLRGRVGADDAALRDTVDALARTVDGAAHSHELASAKTDDPNGLCLAPAVIPLNAGAVDRAADAVLTLERSRETM